MEAEPWCGRLSDLMRSGYGDRSEEQSSAHDWNSSSTESPTIWSDSETKSSDESMANAVDDSEPSEPDETVLMVDMCQQPWLSSFEFMGDHLEQRNSVDIDWDDWILWSSEHPGAVDTTWSDNETVHDATLDISINGIIEAHPGFMDFSLVSSAFDFIDEYPEDTTVESSTTLLEQNQTAPTFSAFQDYSKK